MLITNFIKTAKENFDKVVLTDSTGISLTFGQTLTAGILLAREIAKFDGANIAILFPASVGGALAHVATAFTSKTPVGLNFIAGTNEQEHVLELCEVKTIFTSRQFIEKANIAEDRRMVFIEDVKEKTPGIRKLFTFLMCKYRSADAIASQFACYDKADKTAIILFTSGSESNPKGVPLTNYNVYATIQNYSTVFDPRSDDVILGTLPFFHVFGFAVCLWYPLLMGIGVMFHPNPTDYERLGKIVDRHRVTMLLGTSTLYRGYAKKWRREQVATVRLAFAGAEKLGDNVRERFYEKLGITILEGYGVTESSSCISANAPDNFRHGSVGTPLPDVRCKIVDPDTFDDVAPGEEGMILINGPNVMRGYYKDCGKTADAFHNGFYITGDIGRMEDRFLIITDRLKRFAKIGGEMVPLTSVEDKLSNVLDAMVDGEKRVCAVVSIPHDRKGEQIVGFVVSNEPDKLALNARLNSKGLTKLAQPDHYLSIEDIPVLPSGKVDYKSLKQIAIDRC